MPRLSSAHLRRAPFEQHVRIAFELVGQALHRTSGAANLAQRQLRLGPKTTRVTSDLTDRVGAALGVSEQPVLTLEPSQERVRANQDAVELLQVLRRLRRELRGVERFELCR